MTRRTHGFKTLGPGTFVDEFIARLEFVPTAPGTIGSPSAERATLRQKDVIHGAMLLRRGPAEKESVGILLLMQESMSLSRLSTGR